MKVFVALLLLAAFAAAEFTKEHEQAWIDFKVEHGKMFLSPGKEKKRKEAFVNNYDRIHEHNKAFERGEAKYKLSITRHADLTFDSFKKRFTGVMRPEVNENTPRVTLRGFPPRTLDLRPNKGNAPIKDQNPCGSCWAFSTLAAVEYAYWQLNGDTVDLSEQHLVDCAYGRDGCAGGWMSEVMDWMAQVNVALEGEYPYTRKFRGCPYDPIRTNSPVQMDANVYGKAHEYIADDDEEIKKALATYGILAVCVDVQDWNFLEDGFSQILTKRDTYNLKCEHAVNLVGYDIGRDPSGNEVPYWIVKNQWGTNFGHNGYIYLDGRRDSRGKNRGGLFTDTVIRARVKRNGGRGKHPKKHGNHW
ncbi:crustapain-like [Culicoides brevitarsis]|uniref:crustapain-like n=1 Tax=Culicoides brevitarsis TaxID=469753 RepID=UPI00307C9DA0